MDDEERYVETMTIRRGGRIVAYAFLSIAGALASFGPPTLIENQVNGLVPTIWALCMLVSAFMCLLGSITDRWIGEYSGLPLLWTVLGFFGLVLLISARETGNFPVYAYALTILALSAKLVARWQDVKLVKRHAIALGRTVQEG